VLAILSVHSCIAFVFIYWLPVTTICAAKVIDATDIPFVVTIKVGTKNNVLDGSKSPKEGIIFEVIMLWL